MRYRNKEQSGRHKSYLISNYIKYKQTLPSKVSDWQNRLKRKHDQQYAVYERHISDSKTQIGEN